MIIQIQVSEYEDKARRLPSQESLSELGSAAHDQRACALLAEKPRGRFVELIPVVADLPNELARLVSRNVMLLCEISNFVRLARRDLPAIGPAAPFLAVWHV
jgi:hypothetical protein